MPRQFKQNPLSQGGAEWHGVSMVALLTDTTGDHGITWSVFGTTAPHDPTKSK
jgi:hypothetical protein